MELHKAVAERAADAFTDEISAKRDTVANALYELVACGEGCCHSGNKT